MEMAVVVNMVFAQEAGEPPGAGHEIATRSTREDTHHFHIGGRHEGRV